mmetsp:Transcript_14331/g.38675  ORF Transcript_14331/g.38675 Transcript_14331/m.38675 type:complete len:291 (+) Transcript_14331:332-1204(+)
MATRGPKVSSVQHCMSACTPSMTVGGAKPAPSEGEPGARRALEVGSSGPPQSRRPPWRRQSSTWAANLSYPASLMRGPIVTPSVRPWPRRSSCSAATTRAANSSRTDSWTSTRLVATQACPALRTLEAMSARVATSRSASAKITNGALPPSSSPRRFTVGAHWARSFLPTPVEPVKERRRTRSSSQKVEPTSGDWALEHVTTLASPAGAPASSRSSSRARAERGVLSAGFTTAVHPAARAGATLRVIMALGKFHGVMAATTPMGCFTTSRRLSPLGACRISPFTRRASSA